MYWLVCNDLSCPRYEKLTYALWYILNNIVVFWMGSQCISFYHVCDDIHSMQFKLVLRILMHEESWGLVSKVSSHIVLDSSSFLYSQLPSLSVETYITHCDA